MINKIIKFLANHCKSHSHQSSSSVFTAVIVIVIVIVFSAAIAALAFTGPGTRTPGTGNPDFWIKSGSDVYYNPAGGGNVGIGTASPGATLEVAGQIKITGGTPGANKVLTSNDVGLANWQAPSSLPSGAIIMYSGAWNFDATGLGTGTLTGWALSNGNNGTPNLSDRFVMGTITSPTPGATGGVNSYSLTVAELPAHSHSISADGAHVHDLWTEIGVAGAWVDVGWESAWAGWVSGLISSAGQHSHGGSTGAVGSGSLIDNRPAFIRLAFIMKL